MRWLPNDRKGWDGPKQGDLVGWNYLPYRVISIEPCEGGTDKPDYFRPHRIVLRPAHLEQWHTAHTEDVHLRSEHKPSRSDLPVIHEHYGLCVHCGQLLPCREMEVQRYTDQEVKRMKRYDQPGVCPACEEPVTRRMESERFANIVVPGGPSVTFHMGRRACRFQADLYREKLGQADSQTELEGM